MTLRASVLALLGLTIVATGGCASNKTNAQLNSLVEQNRLQQAELNRLNASLAAAEARANAATAQLTAAPVIPPTATGGGVMDLTELENAVGAPRPVAGRGTATPAGGTTPVSAGHGEIVLEVSGDVLFDSGRTTIKASATKTLDGIAERIKRDYPGRMIRIEGHTDPTPIRSSAWKDNYELGFVRADAVMNYLAKKGIPQKNMYPASKAATQPKSTTNQALNRRVEIVIEN